ncbi:MAG TPA: methylated-DNA--[protein]-cysteine S-methyltransferase [Verrucomicrobiae bacterium]|nr:methylated-DNA--[protein]-cysteine S-methyltransferase [Verrucomicrobiae bacterium]
MSVKAESDLNIEEMERAWKRRDASYDGLFLFGVKTTGIFCRPSCPSLPQRQNIEFFPNMAAALGAGYRPCKRCRPELASGEPPEWIESLMRAVRENPETRFDAARLREKNLTPERVRRWFRTNYGMTFAAWARGVRLSRAFETIRTGGCLDEAVFEAGFDSHSGFREAFRNTFKTAPGRSASVNESNEPIHVSVLSTPLGPMLAAATASELVLLEFADRRGLSGNFREMRRRMRRPLVPGENALLMGLKSELSDYFSGKRTEFSVPYRREGSPFQLKVWEALRSIPYGTSASYREIAKRLGIPQAVRAVGRANGQNRLYLIIPCHRVIANDGSLSGYGGGVWRKKLLLDLERKNRLG